MSNYTLIFDTREEEDEYYNRRKSSKQANRHPSPPHVGKHQITLGHSLHSTPPTTAAELCNEREATEWIVEDMGAAGALVLIAADSGTGKTTLMYRMAEAISSGGLLMSQLKTIKRKVLFIQADESRKNALDKLKLMGISSNDIHFRFAEDGERWSSINIETLSDQIEIYKYGVIFMDSITTLFGGRCSMNDPEFSQNLYKLNQLASKYNILIVISAHLRKTEVGEKRREVTKSDIMGTATQAGAASDIFAIYPAREPQFENHFKLVCLGKRNCEEGRCYNLQGSREDYSWEIVSTSNDDLLPKEKHELRDQLLVLLDESDQSLNCKEIATRLQRNEEHARRILKDLYLEEKIMREKRKGITGRPTHYYSSFPTPGDTP